MAEHPPKKPSPVPSPTDQPRPTAPVAAEQDADAALRAFEAGLSPSDRGEVAASAESSPTVAMPAMSLPDAAAPDGSPSAAAPSEPGPAAPGNLLDNPAARIAALTRVMAARSDRKPESLARMAARFDENIMALRKRAASEAAFLNPSLTNFCKAINAKKGDTGIELPAEEVAAIYRSGPAPAPEAGAPRPAVAATDQAPAPAASPSVRPPVVLFEQVTKTYAPGTRQEFTAIKDVSFVVEDLPAKGEFVAILGPSGCGKSTVLRLIAGLEPQHPPTSGRVEVFGEPIVGPGADRGMVFQSYTSFDHRTVLGNITFGLECQGELSRKEREQLGKEWIQKVGLSVENDAYKYPHQLSGGMQQRVAIARTLILKPRIILMDEPFGALDPVTRMRMQDLLVQLWREVEATVFFITHSIEEAVYLGDRVFLFSPSPGTIMNQITVPPPDRPAMEMQRDPYFQEVVFELRELIDRMEREAERS